MAFEDQTLKCVTCNSEFVFSTSEQEFYAEKKLEHPPKRCKDCRYDAKKRRQRKKRPVGEYRSPAFGNSEFKRNANNNRPHRHAPAGQPDFSSEYRSPAFREYEAMDNSEEYRAPGFKEYDKINPEEEYRSPAFKEYDGINPRDEYRSPAFGNGGRRGRVERPMFEITCVACGETAMVPFVPEEKEDPMCQDCYKEHKIMLAKERAEELAKEREDQKKLEQEQKEKEAPEKENSEAEEQTDQLQ
ncbi:MAG: zinc-ribbon domain containing protein [Deltaproteobacteria bacterium]|nr:zinc-ribbon domain containing protein [Deltaproteobacteria bacterium]